MIGVKLFVLFCFCVYGATSFSLCPEHSTYNLCADSCAKTCKKPKPKKPCELTCTGPGDCICDPGYYKDDDGSCVFYRDCSKFSSSSSDCDSKDGSCDGSRRRRHRKKKHHRRRKHDSDSDSCESWDKSWCSDESKSSDDKSRCCNSDSSSRKHKSKSRSSSRKHDSSSSESKENCGPNAKYGKCKQKCPETCTSKEPKSCDNKCRNRGCQCKDGFVKDKYDNCIPKGLCKSSKSGKSCGQNEQWSNDSAVPPPICQAPTCLEDGVPKFCPLYTTKGGCVCKEHFLRDKKGRCVSPDDCNKSSGKDSDSDSKDRSRKSKDKSRRKSKHSDSDSDSCESWDSDACSDEKNSSEDKSRCCKWKSKSYSDECDKWDKSWCSDESKSSRRKSRCCRDSHSKEKRRRHRKRYRNKDWYACKDGWCHGK